MNLHRQHAFECCRLQTQDFPLLVVARQIGAVDGVEIIMVEDFSQALERVFDVFKLWQQRREIHLYQHFDLAHVVTRLIEQVVELKRIVFRHDAGIEVVVIELL